MLLIAIICFTGLPACTHHEAGSACSFFALRASGVGRVSSEAKYSNRAILSAKKCFPRRSSIRWIGIVGFRLPLDVADKSQIEDVAPITSSTLEMGLSSQSSLNFDKSSVLVCLLRLYKTYYFCQNQSGLTTRKEAHKLVKVSGTSTVAAPSGYVGTFTIGDNAHLYERYYDQSTGWYWTDHGTPA